MIALLEPADVAELVQLLDAQPTGYLRHFHPFAFTAESFATRLANSREDRYWALRYEGKIAGFFMLRGRDDGFVRPAFGVFVGHEFQGRGLGAAALEHALAWCRGRRVATVMLHVSPENPRAAALYRRAGFQPAGTNPETGDLLMELTQEQPASADGE